MSTKKTADGWLIHHDSLGGGSDGDIVYMNKQVAERVCADKEARADRSCEGYQVKAVQVRILSGEENMGLVGNRAVSLNYDTADDDLKARALRKLTAEDRRVLGL